MEVFFIIRYILSLFCLFSNILVCVAISRNLLLRESPTFRILSVIFIANILDLSKQCAYNYPSDIIGAPVVKPPYDIIFHIIGSATWFAELYLLICMALSHYIALYHAPFYFKIRTQQLDRFIIIILIIAVLIGCIHLIIPKSGFDYDKVESRWVTNPNTFVMKFRSINNYGTQIVTLITLVATDVFIFMKFCKRKNRVQVNSFNSNGSNRMTTSITKVQQPRLGKVSNLRVAANFIILSSCLIIQTIIYNSITTKELNSLVANILMTIAPLFRYSKCWIYCISGSHLRKALVNMWPKRLSLA
ncbi:unnamed protein product [Auanema sp. JU1783]|nr:unnamed protein product [Auanema sp. JU1783]